MKHGLRSLSVHTAVMVAVQAVLLLLQLGYTVLSARAFSPEEFGAFAVASLAVGLGSMLVLGGFSKAAMRPGEVASDRRLTTLAVIAGSVLCAVLMALADPIAALWSVPETAGMVRGMALVLLFAPVGGVWIGALRRNHALGQVTFVSVVAGLAGLGAGSFAVLQVGSPLSLVVLPVTVPLVSAVSSAFFVGQRARPTRQLQGWSTDLRYVFHLSANSAVTYLTYATPIWVMGRYVGSEFMGFWNRAQAVAQVPLESVSRTTYLNIFPWYSRGELDPDARSRRWADLASSTSLVIIPCSLLVLPFIPGIVDQLLGPSWSVSGSMARFVWLATSINSVNAVALIALESSGRFHSLWFLQLLALTIMAVSSLLAAAMNSWLPIGCGVVAASLAVQVALSTDIVVNGLLLARTVRHWLLVSYTVGIGLSAPLWLLGGYGPEFPQMSDFALLSLLLSVYLSCVWWWRLRIGPIRRLAA